MNSFVATLCRGRRRELRSLFLSFKKAMWHHRFSLVLIGIASFYCGVLAFQINTPRVILQVPTVAAGVFFSVVAIYATLSSIYYFFLMLFFIKPKSPIRYLLGRAVVFSSDRRRFGHFISVVTLFSLFATIFSMNKAMIYQVNGFKWDSVFYEIDQLLFGGVPPHEYFSWIFANPFSALTIELVYQLWFYAYYMSVVVVGYNLAYTKTSQIYLLASIITWFVGGNLLAVAFSSAGPIFNEIHGIYSYRPHLENVATAVPYIGSFALMVKEKLLQAHLQSGFTSISAFPSMHVASMTLIVFLCREVDVRAYRISVVGLVLVFVGSIALLWHYSIDSFVGLFMAIVSWSIASAIHKLAER